MLHGGGPDRQSTIPFAALLKNKYQVIFPDIRGYGESHCFEEQNILGVNMPMIYYR